MICEKYSKQVTDLVESNLDEQTAEKLTKHLISCQHCEAVFENLSVQNEVYANLHFGIEPPNDLSARFMAKLEYAEQKESAANKSVGIFERISEVFAFLHLNRAFSATALIVLFALGFGVFKFAKDKEIAVNNLPSPTSSESPQWVVAATENSASEKKNSVSIDSNIEKPEIFQTKTAENLPLKKEFPKAILFRLPKIKKVETKQKIEPEIIKSSAEENQIALVREFETDATRQIEKIEILFRAFRNVRALEDSGQFDVDYEKQQARKLLDKNIQLKQRAENYGTLLTAKTLNEVEPYLLDIANLDGNPSAEQILEVKNRFQNQQIIASLQGF